MFVHGVGGMIGGRKFEESGTWTSDDVIGESSHETATLLFYITMADKAKAADAVADSIVLGELMVEHVKFTAFLQTRYNPDGRPAEGIVDPSKQPLFISNGDFVEK
jgi:hypothetical protein